MKNLDDIKRLALKDPATIIKVAAAALAVLSLAVPPWKFANYKYPSAENYAFLLTPPSSQSEIDVVRLLMGLLIIAILAYVALALFKSNTQPRFMAVEVLPNCLREFFSFGPRTQRRLVGPSS